MRGLPALQSEFREPQRLPRQPPREWQPKLLNSPLDLNHNRIEDSLEGTAGPVVAVVSLNRCLEPADRARLAALGTIALVGRHVSFVVLRNVVNLTALAVDPAVAFVGADHKADPTLAVSNPTVKVRASSMYSPYTVEDALPAITGSGVSIAILDSGVDDLEHLGLQSRFVGGADCVTTCTETNPDDD